MQTLFIKIRVKLQKKQDKMFLNELGNKDYKGYTRKKGEADFVPEQRKSQDLLFFCAKYLVTIIL